MSDHGKSSSSSHSSKRRETEEERAIRKEKERRARENETEDERKIRKEKERKREEEKCASGSSHDRKKETEEERRIRKDKEASGRRRETEEERAIRKEKERKERENETEEERKTRKEKERKREEEKRSNKSEPEKRKETEDERNIRKEKERKDRENETEEQRRMRKESGEKESSRSRKETEEERVDRKEKESRDKIKCKDEESEVKTKIMELDENYFLREEARLDEKLKKEVSVQNEENSCKEEEPMEESDDDVPLAQRKKPLAKRKKIVKNKVKHSKRTKTEDDEDFKPKKDSKKGKNKDKLNNNEDEAEETKPTKKLTKKEKDLEEEKNVWKWWEEKEFKEKDKDKKDDGIKWKFLEHNGPLLAPDYEPLPPDVRFWYDGKIMRLSETTEEVCTFYAKMLDHDYTTKDVFNKNFMRDWRSTMTEREREKITDLSKCDFTEIHEHFKKISEERKARSKEEKQKEKEKNAKIQAEYGMCSLDGHQEKIGNYRVEPPGLFRGRGEHPKQGMVKRRVPAKDIIINCSKDSKYPKPPAGHKWKEVKNDHAVTWLASWTENIQGAIKYVMLNPSSKLKAEKDMDKYEKARKLKDHIENIRKDYQSDYKEKEMRLRQRAVALYFIDKLALRAGNEKDEDQADTVGCCSLRCEHIELYEEKDGNEWVVEFDFLGKDSIRYYNVVEVEKRVWKNLKLFKREKGPTDELFDRLNTTTLNDYLKDLMPGLSAKVFRTYNASITLQEQLDKLTNPDDNIAAKMLSYNRANREVAVLCNHQRAVPKTHDKSMANLMEKIEKKEDAIKEAEKLLKAAKKAYKNGEDKNKEAVEKRKKAVERLREQLEKLEIQRTDKDENKTIALGTSKLNYLDPRISVAWCKKHDVPIEKVYNKTQRQKFMWAINMAGPDYVF